MLYIIQVMRKILFFVTIFIVVIADLPIKAQENHSKMDWIFNADIVTEIFGNKILYDANSLEYKGKSYSAEMFIRGNKLFLAFVEGNIITPNKTMLFTVSDLTIDWINSQANEETEGIRWEGVACSEHLNNRKLALTIELYENNNLSIRIGENLKLCKNFKNLNMDILVGRSHIKGDTSNLNYGMTIFYPQNATIIDSDGSHNFTSYDCPNMNVIDNGNTIGISWGGDNVVLNKSYINSDTYSAVSNTSSGKVTIKAFRSSASGKIYLVTVAMPNPTSDVLHITINFKP